MAWVTPNELLIRRETDVSPTLDEAFTEPSSLTVTNGDPHTEYSTLSEPLEFIACHNLVDIITWTNLPISDDFCFGIRR